MAKGQQRSEKMAKFGSFMYQLQDKDPELMSPKRVVKISISGSQRQQEKEEEWL